MIDNGQIKKPEQMTTTTGNVSITHTEGRKNWRHQENFNPNEINDQ